MLGEDVVRQQRRHLHGHLRLSRPASGSFAAMRVAYLGPAGTFSEDALRAAAGGAPSSSRCRRRRSTTRSSPSTTARAERALVPFENSIEGSVRATLDALAFDAPSVAIVGEHDQPISQQPDRPHASSSSSEIEVVLSHPAGERAVRALHPRPSSRGAEVRAAASTADAVREVAAPRAALGGARRRRGGARSTAASCCARGSRTSPATSPGSSGWRPPGPSPPATGAWKTTLSFSELGADHPGALVEALTEFSSRDVNLTRIESRPLRAGGSAATCSSRPRGRASRSRRSPRRSRRCGRRPRTCACSAATRCETAGIPGA